MEKELSKGLSLILPFLYELRMVRQHYPFITYLAFAVELTMLLAIPIDYSEPVADTTLMAIVDLYDQYLLENKTVLILSTLFFIAFMILVLLACLTEYLQSKVRKSSKWQNAIGKFKRLLLYSFVGSELIIMPGFIMSAQNVLTGFVPSFQIINYLLLPFTLLSIVIGGNKRLFGWHCVLIILSHALIAGIWTPFVMFVISFKLGLDQVKQMHKKLVYLLFAAWTAIIVSTTAFKQQIDSFYLLLALLLIAAITALNPKIQQFTSHIEENQYLIYMTENMMQGKELSAYDKQLISHCIFRVKQDFVNLDKRHIQGQEEEWLINFEFNSEKQQMADFLTKKVELQVRKQPSYSLKMQLIECQIKFTKFNIKTLYELQKLINDIKVESTYEEKQKMFELVSLANSKFLKRDENINANQVITIEGYTEELYEYFINIAVIMQELWVLHGKRSLKDQNMSQILRKVIDIEGKADETIEIIGKHRDMSFELAIFDHLKKMINNGHKMKEQRQFQMSKKDLHNSEYSSYILIQQGNILKMSNRLLNQCSLTKSQSQGYRINDIFNQPIADYLYKRLNRILEQENHQEETNFIIPLKVSREHNYIQPYRTTIEILPQIINGIKYILHFTKTPDIQKVPFLLYSAKTDTILSITKNFKDYFNIQSDHFIFNSYLSQVFNADIMAMAQSQDKSYNQIICECKLKKKKNSNTTIIQKVLQIPVKLKKVKYYKVNNENIVLLSIAKREEADKTNMHNIKSQELPFMDTKEKTSNQKATNQLTFCKIPNPYENLIDQKVSKMKEFSRMSYQKIIVLLMLSLMIILVGFIIVFTVKIDKMSDKIMQNYNNQILKSDKWINTLVIYSQSSILHMVRKYPSHLLKISPSYSISALVSDYVKKVSKGISTVLTEEINNQIYAYSAHPSGKSAYDILENAKKGMATQDLRDLVASWSYMKDIVYQEPNSSNQNLDALINVLFYFGNAIIALFATIIVSLEVVSYKIQQISMKIISLYENIDHAHAEQFAQKYRQFIHGMYCSNKFRGVKANKYLKLFITKASLDKIEEADTLCYLEKQIGLEIHQSKPLNGKSIDKPTMKREFAFSFLYKESYVFLLLVLLVFFIQIFLYTLNSYKSQFQDILSHEMDLHNIRNNISFGTSFFMISSLQEILPAASRLSPVQNKVINLSTDISSQLPAYFSDYLKNESHLLTTNLCNLNLTSQIIYQGIVCSQILQGIMTIGLAETIILHNELIYKYSFTNMSQFGDTFRQHSKYPVFMEVLYIRRAVYNLITSLETTFLGYAVNYVGIQNARLQNFIKLAWMLFPLVLCISVCFFLNKRWKCTVCLKSFFVIPKEYLLEMSVTKVLRKQDILSHIEQLAF